MGPRSTSERGVLELMPRSVERPTDAGSTLVAGVSGPTARVDGGGAVGPVGVPWSLDWWIGADDRWYAPAREPTVRQRRLGYGPIVETSVRIPGGDAVHTAYPALVGGVALTVVEIRNESPVPVALALAVRPVGLDARSSSRGPELRLDGAVVALDGRPAVVLPRPPREAGASNDHDLFPAVQAGRPLSWTGPVVGRAANAVCLYPLPHKTALRAVVLGPEADVDAAGLAVAALPDREAVARGWTAVVEAAGRYRFPDPGLTALAGAARARLIIEATALPERVAGGRAGAGVVLHGLAAGGHEAECRASVVAFAKTFPTSLPDGPMAGAEILTGVAVAAELTDRPELCRALLEPAAQLTHLIERSNDEAAKRRAFASLADLTQLAGQPEAASDLRARAGSVAEPADGPGAAAHVEVVAMAQSAAPAGRWVDRPADAERDESDSPEQAAQFWVAARRLLLGRPASGADGTVTAELLPGHPASWRGGTVEVHDAPLAGRRVSFAVRWHGYRPALLWEVASGPASLSPAPAPLELRCAGLDPHWVGREARGEALLAGTADEPSPAPAAGDSFR